MVHPPPPKRGPSGAKGASAAILPRVLREGLGREEPPVRGELGKGRMDERKDRQKDGQR